MHEWAIAEAIVREVERNLKRTKVSSIRIVLGELQNIDKDILDQYLKMMIREVAPSVKISYETEEALFRCRRCGLTWKLKDVHLTDFEREAIHFVPESVHAYVKCPRCGSPDFSILKGRGVKISFEVEEQ
ncbi:MAG: hydrogenase nickel incorporation protein HypA [Desulfurococcales archaeon]|nr:hydrogenase nickel incorporation protein HypA [Desulfurococcales archaeon]